MGRSSFRILRLLEEQREARWDAYADAAELKLRWRALFAQKYLRILPGEKILEMGAGGGALTEALSRVLRGQNPVTSVVFSPECLGRAHSRAVPNTVFVPGCDFIRDIPLEQFDFVIGSGVLWHAEFSETLELICRTLKPGGQILFFEPNLRFPARHFNEMAARTGDGQFERTPDEVVDVCARSGLTDIELVPHDIVSCRLGLNAMRRWQAKAILVEHAPALRLACGSMYLSARKPGERPRPVPNLAEH